MSNFRTKAQEMLIFDEGDREKLYRCPAGKLTIGVGHNIEDNGLPYKVRMALLQSDIDLAEADALIIFGSEFDEWPELVRLGVINMIFNLGGNTFRKFKNTIRHLKAHGWSQAALSASKSLWAKQVPNRAERVLKLLRNESYPY